MFTKKALLTKWGLYALALLLLIIAQQFLDVLPPFMGVLPFLMPMIVAVVAALEGSISGTIFGTVVGFLCDLSGGGVFSGVYTLSFFCIALIISIISKYWVMRNVFGSLIYALIAFLLLDGIQGLYLLMWKSADPLIILSVAGREILISLLFVIPIFFIYNFLHRLFRYE